MKKLLMCLLLAGCSSPSPKIYYGETYRVTEGFWKGCVGQAEAFDRKESSVQLKPAFCRGKEFYYLWINAAELEHQNVTIQESK